ncbi:unnamed protein product [Hymenolepis diminuta]|uniref:HTH psq-type domain-containing protein n=1 Tax=Hymenolepis diminuta TaxID=6216 RepID=A0A0R3SMM8_HYMDI|nr:unnamed protein product [Hymenolepis diminuta]
MAAKQMSLSISKVRKKLILKYMVTSSVPIHMTLRTQLELLFQQRNLKN